MSKNKKEKKTIPVEKIEVPVKKFREDNVDYFNTGRLKGVLARDPQLATEKLLILTVVVRDDHARTISGTKGRNGEPEKKQLYHFPTFTVVGKKAAVYARHLKKGQVVEIEYKLETRKSPDKNSPGKFNYFSSLIVTDMAAGKVLEGDELPYILEK